MNFLITGGCGFIGRELIKKILRSNENNCVRVLDNESVCTRYDLKKACDFNIVNTADIIAAVWHPGVVFCSGDIEDATLLSDLASNADIIVHLAANTGVAPSVENPRADCITNVVGTLNVLEACRLQEVGRMVMASSGAPLGVQKPPLHEELAPHPASPYGASKLAGEGYCSAYFHSFGVKSVVLRFGNVYGPGSGHKSSVVAKFIRRALAGQSLEIYGDGGQTRDFIYIDDLVAAILAATHKEGVGGETFQIATSEETSVAEVTRMIKDVMEAADMPTPEVVFSKPRVGDVARNFSDTSKALRMLDWKAKTSLIEGLERTLQFFIDMQPIDKDRIVK